MDKLNSLISWCCFIMAADRGNSNFTRYVYRGEEGEIIPPEATHIIVGEDCTFVRARAFMWHHNIVEVICHEDVEKIEKYAFDNCPRLRRVVMPGVKVVEGGVFNNCKALSDVECGKLEKIEEMAFSYCESLESMNLPSARIVKGSAFYECTALTDAKFSNKLESIHPSAFAYCSSLKQITIPLKDGIIAYDDIFRECHSFRHIDLVEEAELHETIAALQLEEWRNDMNKEMDSINQILPNAPASSYGVYGNVRPGEKAHVIWTWIRSFRRKIIHYKAEHQRVLNEAATTLQFALPQDIVTKSVLPFLDLS